MTEFPPAPDDSHLRVLELSTTQPLPAASEVPPGVHLIRITGGVAGEREVWEERGFRVRPAWVAWIARPRRSREEYLRSLPRKVRQDTGRALARAQALQLEVVSPVRAGDLAEFLALYRSGLSGMAHGFDYASEVAGSIVDDPHHVLLRARAGDRLEGGLIGQAVPGLIFKFRFSAVTARARRDSLARVLYLRGFDLARDRGLGVVSMGNDPNLYGGDIRPGLFAFKCRLGFRCVAAAQTSSARDGDVAERWLAPPPREPYFSLAHGRRGFLLSSTSPVAAALVPDVPWITDRSVVSFA